MAHADELRLVTKVAVLYHEDGARQRDIAQRLGLSQSAVSRLLQRAEREGIVRVTVRPPPGAHPHLERDLAARYGLDEAIVVDPYGERETPMGGPEAGSLRELGAACAFYVQSTLGPDEVVGVSAHASAGGLLDALAQRPAAPGVRVVQLSGGVGNPAAAEHHSHVTRALAARLGGEAVLLPAPGLAASPAARRALLADPYVRAAHGLFDSVSLALLGVGTTHPPVQSPAGYMGSFSAAERARLAEHGAVGFVSHRFFDAAGRPVATPFDGRIMAISTAQLRRVPRRVGICGGPSRWAPLRAALLGRWLSVLITDRATAEHLLTDTDGDLPGVAREVAPVAQSTRG